MFLHGKKRLGKKDRKGWHYDKILVPIEQCGVTKQGKYHLLTFPLFFENLFQL